MRSASRTTGVSPRTRTLVAEAAPIGLAVGAYGLSYGVLAVAAGLSPLVATVSSLIVLAGGSQFAFVGVLAAGGAPLAGAAAGLMVNARYLAFGFALAPHLEGGPVWRRALDGYLVVDESVALALARPEEDPARRFRVTGWTVVTTWIGATGLGAYGGALIGDPRAFGLDAAFPAGFLALLAPWLRTRQGRVAAGVGAVLAIGLQPVAPPGLPIVAASLGAVVALLVGPGTPEPQGDDEAAPADALDTQHHVDADHGAAGRPR
jgi:predicted branched-subunit amino acid permease